MSRHIFDLIWPDLQGRAEIQIRPDRCVGRQSVLIRNKRDGWLNGAVFGKKYKLFLSFWLIRKWLWFIDFPFPKPNGCVEEGWKGPAARQSAFAVRGGSKVSDYGPGSSASFFIRRVIRPASADALPHLKFKTSSRARHERQGIWQITKFFPDIRVRNRGQSLIIRFPEYYICYNHQIIYLEANVSIWGDK